MTTAEEDQHRARRLAHDVGIRIRERIEVTDMERVAVAELGAAFGVDRVLLRRVQDAGLGPVVAQWHEVDLEPLDQVTLVTIAQTTDPAPARKLWDDVAVAVHFPGREDAGPWPPAAAGLASVWGTGTVLVVAFGAGQDLLGTLTLLHPTPRTWSEAEVFALESLAADIGRASQHAGLYERERRLVRELKELDRIKTDFLSTVSHELRTPLTSITGHVEMLRDGDAGPVGADQMRMLDAVDRNADRLLALIEDLLAISRVESRGFRAQEVPVDVASLVANAVAVVRPQAAAAGLDLVLGDEWSGHGPSGQGRGPVQVLGDPGQLDRVLLNLLSNSVKFTPSGGRVGLLWSATDDEVLVRVQDTGIGVPPEELASLGDRFFRASNATSAAIQGTGLGLTIVRGILEQHGGTLEVRSELGQGTEVQARLPRLVHREQDRTRARL